MTNECDSTCEGTSTELNPRDGIARREHFEEKVSGERMPLGGEHRLLAIDENIALFPRGEHNPLSLERARDKKSEKASA